MRSIYIINFQMTGCNGNVIHCTQEAFLNLEKAKKGLESITETFKNDPNFMAYICGPILLNED